MVRICVSLAAAALAVVSAVAAQKLPSGVTSLAPRAKSAFCKQFNNIAGAVGKQSGSNLCVDTPQGLIPDVGNMVSALITSPKDGSTVDGSKAIEIRMSVSGLDTNIPALDLNNAYLMSPQTLGSGGLIEGFCSVSVQQIRDSTKAPSSRSVNFFKSFTDGGGSTSFTASVPANTLKPGNYRICSMTTSLSGWNVIMPVAQRGSQDDCVRIKVRGSSRRN